MDPIVELEEVAPSGGHPARRAVAIGTAVALALGAAGFAAGRLTATDGGRTTTATGAEPADTTPAAPATDAPAPVETTAASAETAVVADRGEGEDSAASPAYSGGGGGGQYSAGAYEEPEQELIAERTTADGLVLRAHQSLYTEGDMVGQYWPGADFGEWEPASWCTPSGSLRITITSPQIANLGWAPWYSTPKDDLSVSSFAAGYAEGFPAFGVAVQVVDGVTNVTLTTSDGRIDSAAPVDDLALLAVNGPIDENFSITIDRAEGPTTVGVDDLTASWSDASYRDACEPPPPALPDAGEQPADPAAARAAVEDSWTKARDFGALDQPERLTYIDDPTGIADAWAVIAASTYAEAAATSQSTIRDLVFTSPTEAWVRYDIASTVSSFANRYGILRLGDDGVWRVTRATVCQDLALVPEAACVPGVETVLPPSAETDPRFNPDFRWEDGDTATTAAPAED